MIRTLSLASLVLAIALYPTRSAAQDDPDDAEVRTRLARRVSVDATDVPFEDVVQLISETAEVGIVIDPASKLRGKTVTFRAGEVTADEALGRLVEDRGAVRAVRDGLVLLTTAARLAAYPPPLREPPEGGDPERNDVLARIAAKRMTLDFTDTPLDDVLQFVMNVTQVNVVPDPVSLATLEGDGTVSLNVKDVRLSHALNVLAFLTVVRPPGQAPQPLRWGARHGVLILASARRLEEFPALPPAPPDEGGRSGRGRRVPGDAAQVDARLLRDAAQGRGAVPARIDSAGHRPRRAARRWRARGRPEAGPGERASVAEHDRVPL